uniref:HNH endonuclease family protein n=1 Tax=Ornithobacterium rhinotracheale TaxID=28251 RepID=UPI0039A73857
MNIKLKEITIRELVEGYQDHQENGVVGYSGKLDIRPPYQREFVYNEKQRNAVIDTIERGFPLNVMYWAVRDDGTFEVIDGQQRTISICQFVAGDFSCIFGDIPQMRYFHNLQEDEKNRFLDYKLMVYVCEGTDSEKLEWFKTINIAGEKLEEQELRNAVYTGSWLADAKRYFSRTSCPAYQIGHNYLTGAVNRQKFLETAIKWISNGNIEIHMSKHQNDPTAINLWNYFQSVISWVGATFPEYRKEMKGIEWGELYNEYKDAKLSPTELEEQIKKLMLDDDVTAKKGIYYYVLTGKEKHLNIRAFTPQMKREAYERQEGICPMCEQHFEIEEMEADHITPWHEGGKTNPQNCQMLCKEDNRRKSGK